MDDSKIADALLYKFVNEEIVTKTELSLQLNTIMEKYTKHIDDRIDALDDKIVSLRNDVDKRFEQVDKRFEQIDKQFEQVDRRFESVLSNYRWILGTVLAVGVALGSLIIKFWH